MHFSWSQIQRESPKEYRKTFETMNDYRINGDKEQTIKKQQAGKATYQGNLL